MGERTNENSRKAGIFVKWGQSICIILNPGILTPHITSTKLFEEHGGGSYVWDRAPPKFTISIIDSENQ